MRIIARYHGSLLGRDFKAWAQIGVFIVWDFLSTTEKEMWLALAKVCSAIIIIIAITFYTFTFLRSFSCIHTVCIHVRMTSVVWLNHAQHSSKLLKPMMLNSSTAQSSTCFCTFQGVFKTLGEPSLSILRGLYTSSQYMYMFIE